MGLDPWTACWLVLGTAAFLASASGVEAIDENLVLLRALTLRFKLCKNNGLLDQGNREQQEKEGWYSRPRHTAAMSRPSRATAIKQATMKRMRKTCWTGSAGGPASERTSSKMRSSRANCRFSSRVLLKSSRKLRRR